MADGLRVLLSIEPLNYGQNSFTKAQDRRMSSWDCKQMPQCKIPMDELNRKIGKSFVKKKK